MKINLTAHVFGRAFLFYSVYKTRKIYRLISYKSCGKYSLKPIKNTRRVLMENFFRILRKRVDFRLTLSFFFGYNARIIQEQTKSQRTTERGEKP